MQFLSNIFALGVFATAVSAAAVPAPATDVLPPKPFAIVNAYAAKGCGGATTAFSRQQGQSGCFPFKGQSVSARGYNCTVTAWTGANCNGPVGDGIQQNDVCVNFPYQSIQIKC